MFWLLVCPKTNWSYLKTATPATYANVLPDIMKQALQILLAYLTCDNPVMVNKWNNILHSFWHKDNGDLIKTIAVNQNHVEFVIITGEGNEQNYQIPLYQEPNSFPIDKIEGLTVALNGKVDKVDGMGLSENSFTDAEKQKLETLQNYVHPDFHTMDQIEGLSETLQQINDNHNALVFIVEQLAQTIPPDTGLRKWNGYLWQKSPGNNGPVPIIGEVLEGRGDGRFLNGQYVKGEVTQDDPQNNEHFNPFVSYP